MKQDNHIVQQQKIEIQFENFSEGIGIQNEMAELFYEQLYPKMEVLFDELASEKYSITIDKLEVDCGTLSRHHWKEELVEETLRHLRTQLITANKREIKVEEIADREIIDGSAYESLMFYLKNGYLPWNSRVHSIHELEEIFSKGKVNPVFIFTKLKELFGTEPFAAERFVNSFPENLVKDVISQFTGNKITEPTNIFIDEQKTNASQKRKLYSFLLKTLSDYQLTPEELHSILNEESIINEKPEKITKGRLEGKKDEDDKTAIYIANAGLVILHPFLPELFRRIDLFVDKKWKDISSQHTAACVLEYLARGNEEFAEFNLPLNKILCGLDISEVLQPVEVLPLLIKPECGDLLREVIRHWSILKNTSVEGLRETFLQRNGKLTRVDNGWLLNVEQKGVDILLNSLPWGIGVIKLPWTDDTFFVEWI